ncbi:Uu.00g007900.m01.CDS01 [Anthostomella pinea]|uniref:Uu.00g007900.m01.CDS01 n=1 Tax=Anthostomella pinea TaxID=933095 RepID=A0AAI8VRC6_9PEZI|nr:Uu.00g007900.m01.CDS01 [Anthostomella pinea]
MAVHQAAPPVSGLDAAFPLEKAPVQVSAQEIESIGHELTSPSTDKTGNFLVVSPYTEKEHLLDLRTLDTENALLAQALVHMQCLRPDYATAPYVDTFNWPEVVKEVSRLARQHEHPWKETSFYIVVFRSQIPPTTVYAELGALDKAAHAEATASGGFLKYWFGSPDRDGRNLATCLWRTPEDARKGGVGPAHRQAASAARHLYSHWKIDRHRLIIRDDVQSWELIDWA